MTLFEIILFCFGFVGLIGIYLLPKRLYFFALEIKNVDHNTWLVAGIMFPVIVCTLLFWGYAVYRILICLASSCAGNRSEGLIWAATIGLIVVFVETARIVLRIWMKHAAEPVEESQD